MSKKPQGVCENDRNAKNRDCIKSIIREVFGVEDVIVGHHLVYVREEKRGGFTYQVVEEIPAVDTLIFDHVIAKSLWGRNFRKVLTRFACEPVETRDDLLLKLYRQRL